MAKKAGQLKPFLIEEKREGPLNNISEATANKWIGNLTANIKKDENWLRLITATWGKKKSHNRGFPDDDDTSANHVQQMLEYVSQFAPNCLYRDITARATSLSEVWLLVRQWAGLKSSGCKQLVYFNIKKSFTNAQDMPPTDFYFALRNAKEDCLLLSRASGGKVTFNGTVPHDDEDLSPTLENDVVLDWLEAIGGNKLVEHVFRVFSKELESESLFDIRLRISESLTSLVSETEMQAELNRASVRAPFRTFKRAPTRQIPSSTSSVSSSQRIRCKLCQQVNPQYAHTHDISTCNRLNQFEKRKIACALLAEEEEENTTETYPCYEFDESQEQSDHEDTASVSAAIVSTTDTHRICKVNIRESPILACSHNNKTIYLVLDTGATASLISEKQAKDLNLRLYPTTQKAVQVDGETDLPILGEVHTSFKRGNLSLRFEGLVVANLGVDILAGTPFHVDNDVYCRMSKGTIHVGNSHVFQSTPPALLNMKHKTPNQRLIRAAKTCTILPGDSISFVAPPDIDPEEFVMVEPNTCQTAPFFESHITQLSNSKFEVENSSNKAVTLKKNCQAVRIYRTTSPSYKPHQIQVSPDITPNILDIVISPTTSPEARSKLLKVARDHENVFNGTLPGYNGAFGTVYADFKFASKARPQAQKLRSPAYGSYQELLFNEKCQQLKSQGVLIDPQENNIVPSLTHNSWVVRKPSAASKSWEDCTKEDVRLVVGLDPLNKFLKDPPGKITKTDTIYTAISNWSIMGEVDFSDFYFQIKFRTSSDQDKDKLGYLCIRTALGTLCFSRATMGLLGMDTYQDELTDRVLGDLVLSNKVVKICDNIYFGASTMEEFIAIFNTILGRCATADLKLKPNKVKLVITSADILGLHWHNGKLSPSRHKIDPLSTVPPPNTVKGLRSWLGGIRFHEICLPGSQLAALTKPLDEQIPSSRSGKEEIVWSPTLLSSFKRVQEILKQPHSVTIPRKGDQVYLATDACSSLPAGGSKMFIKRPGEDKFLPSFNFGSRLPDTVKDWSPCEVEAYFLNKGIQKAELYTRATGNPGIALTDNKPVFQAKQNLDSGKFSTSKRLQDLLANLSSKRFSIQLMSAKLPSPILSMVDFFSRNPVECTSPSCTICSDTSTVAVGVVMPDQPNLQLLSKEGWKDLQQSCPDLRRTHALLSSGAKLSKKEKDAKDLKSYLQLCTINSSGLVVKLKNVPLQARPAELIVIPRMFAFTLAKTFHVNLNHPSPSQMLKQFQRKFFTLDEKQLLQKVYDSCEYPCQATKILPKELPNYKTCTIPSKVGEYYNADVLEESNQKVLVVRENVTGFTDTAFIPDQTKPTMRAALISILSRLRVGPTCFVRVDNQASLTGLRKDKSLEPYGIQLILGDPKNVNKNAIVDKAIRELREQIVRLNPLGGKITTQTLALATAHLNDLIRHSGLSSRELWLSRDAQTSENLPIDDKILSRNQLKLRESTHASSAKYHSRNAPQKSNPSHLQPGSSVYVKSDRSKSKSRDQFIVLSLDKEANKASIQKFPMKKFRSHPIKVDIDNLYPTHKSLHPVVDDRPSNLPERFITKSKPVQSTKKSSRRPRVVSSSDSDSSDDDQIQNTPVTRSQTPSEQTDTPDDHISDPGFNEPHEDVHDEAFLIPEADNLNEDISTDLVLYQPKYGDEDYLQVGDIIVIVHNDYWVKAILHKYSMWPRNDSLYWTYSNLDGSDTRSGYLFPGESWGVLRGDDLYIDVSTARITFPQ